MSTAHTTTTHRQRHAAIARGAQFLHWQTYFRLHFRYACCSSHSGPHAWYSFLQVVSHSSSAFRSASSFFVCAFGTRFCVARRSLIVRFEALAPGSIAASIGGHWRSTRCIGHTPCKGGRPWSSPPRSLCFPTVQITDELNNERNRMATVCATHVRSRRPGRNARGRTTSAASSRRRLASLERAEQEKAELERLR